MLEFSGYLLGKGAERKALLAEGGEPPDDLLTSLLQEHETGQKLTDDEFVGCAIQLMAAGHETISNFISNAVYLLCTQVGERAKLEAKPELLESAVEEVLRFESPAQAMPRRVTTDTVFGGCPIPSGARVHVLFGAANRDGSIFHHPDRFDIDRDLSLVRQHVAFGFGVHACVGASLARLEGRVALERLLTRLRHLELDPGHQPVRSTTHYVRGWKSLWVRWQL
jgi:cytochrome P450